MARPPGTSTDPARGPGPAGGDGAGPAGPGASSVLDGRYRLLGARATRPHATLWRAVDEVLGRQVAVKVFPLGKDRVAPDTVLAAAGRAGRVADSRLVRLFDVRADPDAPFGYVVSEWLDAPSLTALLRDGPLPGPEAVAIVHEVAQALATAAAVDAYHGALHPDNVFVLPEGAVRITDLEVAATLDESWGDDPADDDVRDIGALLYAATTGAWPRPEQSPLPAARREGDRPVPPREMASGLAREIDGATMRLLSPPRAGAVGRIDTAARAAEVLATLPHRTPGSTPEPSARRASRWPKLLATRALPALAVAVIGLVAWRAGSDLGGVPGQHNPAPSLSLPPSTGPSQSSASHTPIRVVALRDCDPYGDGREDSPEVPLAVDDDPSTAWHTSRYRGSPEFGGLKKGVGLLLDLGSKQEVGQVRVALTEAGASLEVYASDDLTISPAGTSPVGRLDDAPQEATIPVNGPPKRYWLLWITKLPPVDGGFQAGVAELAFLT